MAHNSYIRAGGVWNNASAVTSAEFNLFDVAQFKAANFDDGGTWAPAALIIIGGLGINVTGPATLANIVSATVPASGLITVQSGGNIQVNASGSVVVNGNLTLSTTGAFAALSGSTSTWNSGSSFNCTANATFNGTLTLTTTGDIALGSASVTRQQCATPMASGANWICYAIDATWQNASGALGTYIVLPLDLPNGATLTAVDVYVTGAAAHAGLPAAMPTIQVYKMTRAGVTTTIGAAVPDGSGTTAAFQVNHVISQSGLTEAINKGAAGNRYYVRLTAESGANALALLVMTGWTATYTVTQYDRGVG